VSLKICSISSSLEVQTKLIKWKVVFALKGQTQPKTMDSGVKKQQQERERYQKTKGQLKNKGTGTQDQTQGQGQC
jgi:hypothetical protein